MADSQKMLQEQIRRYRRLHSENADPGARRVLEELIREAEAKLDDIRKEDDSRR